MLDVPSCGSQRMKLAFSGGRAGGLEHVSTPFFLPARSSAAAAGGENEVFGTVFTLSQAVVLLAK